MNNECACNKIYKGEQAVEMCRTSRGFDLVLVDEYLGRAGGCMMGHEVVSILRNELKWNCCTIVGCSVMIESVGDLFMQSGVDKVW